MPLTLPYFKHSLKGFFFFITGEVERVEMVIDDVVVEVSKHRGIGRMYLTNFR